MICDIYDISDYIVLVLVLVRVLDKNLVLRGSWGTTSVVKGRKGRLLLQKSVKGTWFQNFGMRVLNM